MSPERKDGYHVLGCLGRLSVTACWGHRRTGRPSSFSILFSGQHQSCHRLQSRRNWVTGTSTTRNDTPQYPVTASPVTTPPTTRAQDPLGFGVLLSLPSVTPRTQYFGTQHPNLHPMLKGSCIHTLFLVKASQFCTSFPYGSLSKGILKLENWA